MNQCIDEITLSCETYKIIGTTLDLALLLLFEFLYQVEVVGACAVLCSDLTIARFLAKRWLSCDTGVMAHLWNSVVYVWNSVVYVWNSVVYVWNSVVYVWNSQVEIFFSS